MAAAELKSLEAQKSDLLDFPFSLLEVGCAGKVHVCPGGDTAKHPLPPLTTLPHGLPPVLQDLQAQLRGYLQRPEDLPIHDFQPAQRLWPRERDPESLYSAELCPLQTTLQVERNPTSGELLGYKETTLQVERNPTSGELLGYKEVYLQDTGISAKNSLSLRRPPGPPTEATRGSSTNYPFWPGGMDEPDLGTVLGEEGAGNIDFENDLLSCPPGFEHGVDFKKLKKKEEQWVPKMAAPSQHAPNVLNLAEILAGDDGMDWSEEEEEEEDQETKEPPTLQRADSLDNMLPQESQTAEAPTPPAQLKPPQEEQWAVNVDISTPVADFHKRIPNPAYQWPFELDVFQKQAILHLENHDSVTVYTSPIKALSNQKFRDFKQTFEDVGLLTGDVQLRPEAACLIMTTEILRSMLYNGSDVIRDLEWVIFDEVHYINDAERGVVWEEVLIMLPEHVNIILLSATVPNTMEFADWIGYYAAIDAKKARASKSSSGYGAKGTRGGDPRQEKNVWLSIIQAIQRDDKLPMVACILPVSHLYLTCISPVLLQEKNVWLSIIQAIQWDDKLPVVACFSPVSHLYLTCTSPVSHLYLTCITAGEECLAVHYQDHPVGRQAACGGLFLTCFSPVSHLYLTCISPVLLQEKNVWLSIIQAIQRDDKLPVVAFTFSKRRCDDNAAMLTSIDLTTAAEKSEIHLFIQKSLQRLKGPDRDLPQPWAVLQPSSRHRHKVDVDYVLYVYLYLYSAMRDQQTSAFFLT
uniref:Helicase ATP-binding domain-containing protein n=1 Tax=Branchiostoma floridae TaxID=7739 RepID=C3ZRQ2_BRAFL|eukprot:XP_002588841.1 hypothetical protein BRAFLDRAFT_99541 [Branchiostoma floridae]